MATYFVKNTGLGTAEDIEICFGVNPDNFSIWPKRYFEQRMTPQGDLVIGIEKLGRMEFIGIETQSLDRQDLLSTVTYSGVTAKTIRFFPQPVVSIPLIILVNALLFIGLSTVLYWIIIAIRGTYQALAQLWGGVTEENGRRVKFEMIGG